MDQHFPRCTVIVGIEHTVLLLFGKFMAVRQMQEICQFAKLDSNDIDVILFSRCNVSNDRHLFYFFL